MDNSDNEVDDLLSAIKEYYPNASVSVVKNISEDDDLAQYDVPISENSLGLPNLSDDEPMIFEDILNESDINLSSVHNDHDYISPIKVYENRIPDNADINNAEGKNKKVECESLENVTPVNTTPVNMTPVHETSDQIMSSITENRVEELEQEQVDDPDWVPQPHDLSENEDEERNEIVLPADDNQEDEVNIGIGVEKNQRKKKIRVDKNQWFDIKNKSLREKGKNYVGWQRQNNKGKRGPEKEERKMGPTCDSKVCQNSNVKDCQSFDENTRKAIFNEFWEKMSWDQKKVYIVSLVKKTEKKRESKPGEQSRRNFTYEYTIKLPNGNSVPVCKQMFLSTFGLKEWSVMNWVSGAQDHGIVPSKQFINSSRTRKHTPDKAKEILAEFLDKIPKLPSHYCRQSTTKVYIEPTGAHNLSDVYREYQKLCHNYVDGTVKPLSRFTFDLFIQERNLSFQPPKKDRCDLCISHEEGNVSDDIYNKHIERKNRAREEMRTDTENGAKGDVIVLTQDLQSVKICPSLNASALYYKTKLLCHNFTIYNVNSGKAHCYWFDETQCDLSANTYATSVIDYMSKNCLEPKKPIILWSDGCTSQNRNSTFSNALLSFSVEHNIDITQKYLEKGHTQMEVDSVHSVIERKIKNKPIYLPSDYVRYTTSARQKEPYLTTSLTFDFIRNYSVKGAMVYESIRPGKSVGDPTVTDIRAILYSPSGDINTKLHFDEGFQNLPQRKKLNKPLSLSSFPRLHSQPLKISEIKWKNLQDLKCVLPRDCHFFYDNLKFEEPPVFETQQPGQDIVQNTSNSGQYKPTKKRQKK